MDRFVLRDEFFFILRASEASVSKGEEKFLLRMKQFFFCT